MIGKLRIGWKLAIAVSILHTIFFPLKSQVTFETRHEMVVAKYPQSATEAIDRVGAQPENILKIYTGTIAVFEPDQPSIIGSYTTSKGQITFHPMVPFRKNFPYLAVFGDSVYHSFVFKESAESSSSMLGIYPSADTVPANLLKIYLEFSAPMREGQAYERVHLMNEEGSPVINPFVPLQPELWDYEKKRLTLWIDPGRIKRSLASMELHGPVIQEGQQYRLIIDSLWQDSQGLPLERRYAKQFFVTSEERIRPALDQWHFQVPEPSTTDPLSIQFDKTMDFATTINAFTIQNENGNPIDGTATVMNEESYFLYIPENNWIPGKYKVIIKSSIEDLAGNNLNRVFDRDLTNNQPEPSDQEFHEMTFEILEIK